MVLMFEMVKRKNYLNVNLLIKKGMLKRRKMAVAAILNITAFFDLFKAK